MSKTCRCRHGYFHVVNNDYTHWEMYAIGGSAEPTINSQGNRYLAPANPFAKEVIFFERPNFIHSKLEIFPKWSYIILTMVVSLTLGNKEGGYI